MFRCPTRSAFAPADARALHPAPAADLLQLLHLLLRKQPGALHLLEWLASARRDGLHRGTSGH